MCKSTRSVLVYCLKVEGIGSWNNGHVQTEGARDETAVTTTQIRPRRMEQDLELGQVCSDQVRRVTASEPFWLR